MPYVVIHGEVHHNERVYRVGDEVPAMKGTLSDIVAVGAIEWHDSRVEANAEREKTIASRRTATRRKAVKP